MIKRPGKQLKVCSELRRDVNTVVMSFTSRFKSLFDVVRVAHNTWDLPLLRLDRDLRTSLLHYEAVWQTICYVVHQWFVTRTGYPDPFAKIHYTQFLNLVMSTRYVPWSHKMPQIFGLFTWYFVRCTVAVLLDFKLDLLVVCIDRFGASYNLFLSRFLGDRLTVRPMLLLLDRCLSVCLSVSFVQCGQTVGRIKMKLGM